MVLFFLKCKSNAICRLFNEYANYTNFSIYNKQFILIFTSIAYYIGGKKI